MKNLTKLILGSLLIVCTACETQPKDNIAGSYVGSFKNEYGFGNDTIVITVYNENGNTFQVERRESIQFIRNGKILPLEHKVHSWMATYNKEKQLLEESDFGRRIYLKPGFKALKFGGEYRKIK